MSWEVPEYLSKLSGIKVVQAWSVLVVLCAWLTLVQQLELVLTRGGCVCWGSLRW